jgi:hypothetical protein
MQCVQFDKVKVFHHRILLCFMNGQPEHDKTGVTLQMSFNLIHLALQFLPALLTAAYKYRTLRVPMRMYLLIRT